MWSLDFQAGTLLTGNCCQYLEAWEWPLMTVKVDMMVKVVLEMGLELDQAL